MAELASTCNYLVSGNDGSVCRAQLLYSNPSHRPVRIGVENISLSLRDLGDPRANDGDPE